MSELKEPELRANPMILTADDGTVEIHLLGEGRFRVELKATGCEVFIPRRSCETSLPVDIISAFLGRSFAHLCDSLARYEDPQYVGGVLRHQMFSYFTPADFVGKRILDFGCGAGASSFHIAKMCPEAEIVGVDLVPDNVELARQVLSVQGFRNCRFFVSPESDVLPGGIGKFDFVMLSAVYEHLLPIERRTVMPQLWTKLNTGGVLFINQTPYRYFPYENHSTGLWLINYLPDRLAFLAARKFSRINPLLNKKREWKDHLRGGIRGATEAEIIRILSTAKDGRPVVLQPREGDRAAYWLSCTGQERWRFAKKIVEKVFRVCDRLLGTIPSVNLDVAIQKSQDS